MMKVSTSYWNGSKSQNFASLDLTEAAAAKGFMHQAGAGFWQLDAFGAKLKEHIVSDLHKVMCTLGATRMELGLMQEASLWETTGRKKVYGEELFSVKDRKGKQYHLAATAEEAVCFGAKKHMSAGGARTLWSYQIGTKWRDELRARGALARAKEFCMLDAYSFSVHEERIGRMHEASLSAFESYLSELGLSVRVKLADCGEVGGTKSHEIVCKSDALGDAEGELELAHLFELGTKYTQAFDIKSAHGEHLFMGCQGLGVSRLMMALLEARRNTIGFWGDESACSYLFWICSLDEADERVQQLVHLLTARMGTDGIWDDRNIQAGRKLMDSEGTMAAWRIVVSKRNAQAGEVEIQNGKGTIKKIIHISQALCWMDALRAKRAGITHNTEDIIV